MTWYPSIPLNASPDFFEMYEPIRDLRVLVFESEIKELITAMGDPIDVINVLIHEHGYNMQGAMALFIRLRNEL